MTMNYYIYSYHIYWIYIVHQHRSTLFYYYCDFMQMVFTNHNKVYMAPMAMTANSFNMKKIYIQNSDIYNLCRCVFIYINIKSCLLLKWKLHQPQKHDITFMLYNTHISSIHAYTHQNSIIITLLNNISKTVAHLI